MALCYENCKNVKFDLKIKMAEVVQIIVYRQMKLIISITDCGFEHPSQVQHECIPQAILSLDVLCQAKGCMGKTAVFVLAILQQLEVDEGLSRVLVLCHTRELAFQIGKEYEKKFIQKNVLC